MIALIPGHCLLVFFNIFSYKIYKLPCYIVHHIVAFSHRLSLTIDQCIATSASNDELLGGCLIASSGNIGNTQCNILSDND